MRPTDLHSVLVCPGCAGRNDPAAPSCEWCGRPFVNERRQISVPWLAPVTVVGIVALGFGTIVAALIGARASQPRPGPELAAPAVAAVVAAAAEPDGPAPAEPVAAVVISVPDVVSPPARDEFVRIGNTGGTGAFIRREPRAGAPGIVAYRDGIILRVVGDDVTVGGRLWRQVQDIQGNLGWTPAEYLLSSEAGF